MKHNSWYRLMAMRFKKVPKPKRVIKKMKPTTWRLRILVQRWCKVNSSEVNE